MHSFLWHSSENTFNKITNNLLLVKSNWHIFVLIFLEYGSIGYYCFLLFDISSSTLSSMTPHVSLLHILSYPLTFCGAPIAFSLNVGVTHASMYIFIQFIYVSWLTVHRTTVYDTTNILTYPNSVSWAPNIFLTITAYVYLGVPHSTQVNILQTKITTFPFITY